MFFVQCEASFDAAHFLKDYNGKCRNLHGHRWKVLAEAKGEQLQTDRQNRGMVFDFSDLKKALKQMCDALDHCLVYEKGSLRDSTLAALKEENFAMTEVPFRPTAENLAKYFYDALKAEGFSLHRVEVYETPGNRAAYQEHP